MSDVAWPPSLTRAPRLAELTESAPDVVLRSEVDVGPAKLRRRITGGVRPFNIEYDITRTDLDNVFDPFYEVTTKGGSLSFSWKHPRTGATRDFRFTNVPSYRPRAPRGSGSEWWVVSFSVEMLPTGVVGDAPTEGDNPERGGGNGYWSREYEPLSLEGDPEPDVDEAIIFPLIFEADAVLPEIWPGLYYLHTGSDGSDTLEEEDSIGSGAESVLEGFGDPGPPTHISGSASGVPEA